MLERVCAERVIIGSSFHEPGERAAVTEWWPEPSIVFTSHGAWEVHARRGGGDVTPDTVLVNESAAEHDCLHPHGLDGRARPVRRPHDRLGTKPAHAPRPTAAWPSDLPDLSENPPGGPASVVPVVSYGV